MCSPTLILIPIKILHIWSKASVVSNTLRWTRMEWKLYNRKKFNVHTLTYSHTLNKYDYGELMANCFSMTRLPVVCVSVLQHSKLTKQHHEYSNNLTTTKKTAKRFLTFLRYDACNELIAGAQYMLLFYPSWYYYWSYCCYLLVVIFSLSVAIARSLACSHYRCVVCVRFFAHHFLLLLVHLFNLLRIHSTLVICVLVMPLLFLALTPCIMLDRHFIHMFTRTLLQHHQLFSYDFTILP